MKTNKGFASVLIILAVVVIAGVSIGSYYLGKKSNKPQPVEVKEQTQKVEDNQNTTSSGLREFRNDDIGISFMYPVRYGDVSVNVTQKDVTTSGHFNVRKYFPSGEIGFSNLKYFSANFSANKDIGFSGGVECWGCEGGIAGDEVFLLKDQTAYEKFYTNSGDMGLLYRGKMKVGEPCDGINTCYYQGDVTVTFRVNTDYRGITFFTKDTSENIALLKSIIINK